MSNANDVTTQSSCQDAGACACQGPEGQRPLRLNEVFFCEPRRRKLYLVTCLDDYMNANALRVRSMVCFECQQGQSNRESFAADADVEGILDSEIWGKLMAELAATETQV